MSDKFGLSREKAQATSAPGPAPAFYVDLGNGAFAEAFALVDASGNVLGPNSVPAGATIVAVASGTGDTQAVAAQAGLRLVGWTARSNAVGGLTSKTVLRHGTGTGDPALVFVNLQDDQSDDKYYGPEGRACAGGIFVDRDGTNAVEITVFYRVAS